MNVTELVPDEGYTFVSDGVKTVADGVVEVRTQDASDKIYTKLYSFGSEKKEIPDSPSTIDVGTWKSRDGVHDTSLSSETDSGIYDDVKIEIASGGGVYGLFKKGGKTYVSLWDVGAASFSESVEVEDIDENSKAFVLFGKYIALVSEVIDLGILSDAPPTEQDEKKKILLTRVDTKSAKKPERYYIESAVAEIETIDFSQLIIERDAEDLVSRSGGYYTGDKVSYEELKEDILEKPSVAIGVTEVAMQNMNPKFKSWEALILFIEDSNWFVDFLRYEENPKLIKLKPTGDKRKTPDEEQKSLYT